MSYVLGQITSALWVSAEIPRPSDVGMREREGLLNYSDDTGPPLCKVMGAMGLLPREKSLDTQMQISAQSIPDPVLPWSSRRPLAVRSSVEEWVPPCEDGLTGANLPEREEIDDALLPPTRLAFRGWKPVPSSASLCLFHAERSNKDAVQRDPVIGPWPGLHCNKTTVLTRCPDAQPSPRLPSGQTWTVSAEVHEEQPWGRKLGVSAPAQKPRVC